MIRNESTSEQIASYASEILKMERPYGLSADLWKKIQSIAGSALTQTPNKPLSVAERAAAILLSKGK